MTQNAGKDEEDNCRISCLSVRNWRGRTFHRKIPNPLHGTPAKATQLYIVSEIKASMAVGAELDVNFLPNDDLVLRKMIELENN